MRVANLERWQFGKYDALWGSGTIRRFDSLFRLPENLLNTTYFYLCRSMIKTEILLRYLGITLELTTFQVPCDLKREKKSSIVCASDHN